MAVPNKQHQPSDEATVSLFKFRPYSRERVPGVYPEGHLGIGNRKLTAPSDWESSSLKKMYERKYVSRSGK